MKKKTFSFRTTESTSKFQYSQRLDEILGRSLYVGNKALLPNTSGGECPAEKRGRMAFILLNFSVAIGIVTKSVGFAILEKVILVLIYPHFL
ncbi:MAG: hypothetical protein A2845_00390 [Candidatus Lloydbacteria bacterium RIFCSPHIGHO2_01_FULL_49_22]|uniref:Uncharacterized protein n=1 Tax=Candidatus Lloydbacteria bacterium RIFCSPHIGHO2_01_FULL_49_22 TaxID=1798658 RepID=A0A1G2D032_9BACT|nr:MAG: hypothetical protein A2845_00390 [Candidatus Lloydbacteria bacterium RIFCSPHIGHO2_01_FULL_49_22]OGZ09322.1 MAG: hypothetical protein A3C14_05295 [Candidatus Lloydbacteria bacterium RIFCSPHIGHO2_02_FULL_50_18]